MPHIVPVRAFRDNYIWVIRDRFYAAVVDPGDAAPVLDYLRSEKLKLIAILNTHHHNDHVGGNAALLGKSAAPVFGPATESIPALTHPLKESQEKKKDDSNAYLPEFPLRLSVLDIPGHTAGHIAYYGANLLFCGDTLFACGCGRLFEGTAQQMVHSLEKLSSLPDKTQVYCGHEYTLNNIRFARVVEPGNGALAELEKTVENLRKHGIATLPSTIAVEKSTNPFLRCSQPEIIESASRYAGKPLTGPVEVFTAIRDWKNNF
ncbi:MAG: hydroxyacylglutathione hydrolase [Nitrosospira sp.]|nr:hydroxyacylglutathione hydrolase [Nitrosospira sp.]